jgi:AraC family transcriptional regulator
MRKAAARNARLDAARLEEGRPLMIAGIRGHFTESTHEQIGDQWTRFIPQVGKISGVRGAAAYGVCFDSSLAGKGFDYLSGVEVSPSSRIAAGFRKVNIPAQKYAVFAHRGHVSEIVHTVEAIYTRWLPTSGHTLPPASARRPTFFERYGEEFDPRTGRGAIEIWLPIR